MSFTKLHLWFTFDEYTLKCSAIIQRLLWKLKNLHSQGTNNGKKKPWIFNACSVTTMTKLVDHFLELVPVIFKEIEIGKTTKRCTKRHKNVIKPKIENSTYFSFIKVWPNPW